MMYNVQFLYFFSNLRQKAITLLYLKTPCYMRSIPSLLVLLLCLVNNLFAQGKGGLKPSKISASDFTLPASPVIDSNTNAVILSDIGITDFQGNKKGWFSYIFKRRTRIKILNKKAFQLATVKISLYHDKEDEEK